MTYTFKDAQFVRTQIMALLAAYPELEEDATLLADMLDGETDLHRVLEKLLNERLEAETMAAAVKARKDENAERQKRFERKADSVKRIILQLMEAAQQDKVTLPEATLTITKPRTSLNILDVTLIPQGYFVVERKPITAEIKAALERGEQIPGAELSIGSCGLMIRTK